MSTYIPRPASNDRYDDGLPLDYASMIRMWSAFDRSISAFNRECGVIVARRRPDQKSPEGGNKRRMR
jgi:hypothetical protein